MLGDDGSFLLEHECTENNTNNKYCYRSVNCFPSAVGPDCGSCRDMCREANADTHC